MQSAEVRIDAVRTVGPDTIAIDLETPDGFNPRPGQFVKLTAFVEGDHVTRFYTLSSPGADETFELTISIDPDGTLGPWLAEGTGESVQIEGPYGNAAYEAEDASFVIAGGPGIGAAVGIGEAAVADDNDVTIVFGGAVPAHQDRLDDLEAAGVPVVLTDDLETAVPAHFDTTAQPFVYGFQEFVTEALDAIEAAGGDVDEAKVENYG